ncbi:MAG TPA: flagellar motor protein [Candidatus Acidoferrales bacterium]|jgi:chemotaxis protein MotA|nr:flagellar motor protein [Candidatus Acidoferrales bacterium]
MDKATIGGLVLAIVGIFAGLVIEGGSISQIAQPTAAMIVLGGTLGATMINFPLPVVLAAFGNLKHILFNQKTDSVALIEVMVRFANKARKEGIVSLDGDLESITDPFLKKALMLAVDGTESEELRKMMELELDNQAEHDENSPKVFEAAGGFAPTIGIIGAVLGLIQVMQHLDNISEVGRGIAVAFVATIYGVGSANLLFLPAAGKLKLRMREGQVQKEMMLEGVISILEGMNPRMLEAKLQGFLAESDHPKNAATNDA